LQIGSIVYRSLEHLRWPECDHLSRIDHQSLSRLWISALPFFLGFDRPFSESGDHDVITFVEIILDDFKDTFNDTNALFLGDAEFFVNGVDDVNLRQAHDGPPFRKDYRSVDSQFTAFSSILLFLFVN
jgi:hypothetical protein